MSYAAAAAKGPKQSAEEKHAPPVRKVAYAESASSSSLIDVDAPSVHTVPSNSSERPIKTETQATCLEREAEQLENRAAEVTCRDFSRKENEAKDKVKRAKGHIERNTDHPVYVGNALAVVALGVGLGLGTYKKYTAGQLTWKVVAAWIGVMGLFATGDYFLSQYFIKHRYQTNK